MYTYIYILSLFDNDNHYQVNSFVSDNSDTSNNDDDNKDDDAGDNKKNNYQM